MFSIQIVILTMYAHCEASFSGCADSGLSFYYAIKIILTLEFHFGCLICDKLILFPLTRPQDFTQRVICQNLYFRKQTMFPSYFTYPPHWAILTYTSMVDISLSVVVFRTLVGQDVFRHEILSCISVSSVKQHDL